MATFRRDKLLLVTLISNSLILFMNITKMSMSNLIYVTAGHIFYFPIRIFCPNGRERIEKFDTSLTKRYGDLQNTLQERLAVAGPALSAVQQLNQRDEESFQQSGIQERQGLLSTIAWEFRSVLCTIQTLLSNLRVPGFEGTTIDTDVLQRQANICAFLQSQLRSNSNLVVTWPRSSKVWPR